MAANHELLNRVREALADIPGIEEKAMFGGVCFLVDDKMCVCVRREDIMCRLNPNSYHNELEKPGVQQMIHNGRVMKGYVFIAPETMQNKADFNYWISLALEYNKIAKSSKKK
ncbi:TfoX family protein [Mucilaginibacter limnophilus]|uniref:TfoX family protein n=1 Tax=Mucilaginibacter limnophilus TaxID=1932778 RepID=A0A437MYP0_9SPHI|nr:TfoX/Sxy family protein [Mucilaginibacter limnophilus]RVU02729.1 TfoX family protein [Mucilaginibacter limnophilus]